MGDKGQWNMKEGENSENALMEIRTAKYGILKVKDELRIKHARQIRPYISKSLFLFPLINFCNSLTEESKSCFASFSLSLLTIISPGPNYVLMIIIGIVRCSICATNSIRFG